jgi:thiol-disulfide isomerase/thioredoxin
MTEMFRLRLLVPLLAAVLPAPTFPAVSDMPPHLGADGAAEYRSFLAAAAHRAFAIAPGGAFGWVEGKGGRDDAEAAALANCQDNTVQKCVLYASDKQTVFDAKRWPQLWGPYLTAAQARQAAAGVAPGQRFPDLEFATARGEKTNLSRLRGKVTIVHFWGSWCGPCRREMPELQALHRKIEKLPDVALVAMQVRESFAVAQRWAAGQGLQLPLFDSGATGDTDTELRLAGGGRMRDRGIASSFPTTYVLDKHGVVVFSHVGPVHGWAQYEPFLRDAAAHSGK